MTSEDRVTSGDKNRSHAPTVLFLGELGQRKGCYDIPAVAERVLQVIPQARFVLCGAGSPDEETAIRQLFSERHLSDRVEFPGWVRNDEKDRRLRQADVFFLPSYQEGLPMSILDAMGYGLPVVSTKVGGIPELVQDRVNGRLCAPGDIDAMADALIELLQDDSLRLQYGEASLTLVRTEFSLDVHLQALENLWEKALAPTACQTVQ